MREVRILLPEAVYRIWVWLKLGYRKIRYGYAFRKINLTNGKFTIVSPQDYGWLARHKWSACKGGRTFYARRYVPLGKGKCKHIPMHREILKVGKEYYVDHINHNGLDNRRENLRPATPAQNAQHRRKCRTKNTSKYRGVYWNKRAKKWPSRILVNSKSILLGYFDEEEEAAKAYDRAARKYYGEFAELNFKKNNMSFLGKIYKISAERLFGNGPTDEFR
jgi:hypothetical protein